MELESNPDRNQRDISTVSDAKSGDKTGLLENDGISTNGTSSPVGEGVPLQKHDVKRKPNDGLQMRSVDFEAEMHPSAARFQKGCVKKGEGLKVLIISSIAFAIVITVALILQIHFGPPQIAPHGAVAADVSRCSQVGVGILKKGGSAVDAAIATLLCNGVINAQSSGLGGGHFMLVHDHKKMETKVIDARETAPAASTPDMYKNKPEDQRKGAKSIAVPGEVRGMEKAHQLYGKLPWADLFKPAIDIARKGFPVGKDIASVLKNRVTLQDLKYSKALASIYAPDGVMLVEGQSIRRQKLAMTLEKIATKGADEFYTGSISDEIVAEVTAKGGIFTKSDLEKYKPVLRPAITSTFKDQTIIAPPLPSGGATLLMMLNVMDEFNITKQEHGTATYYQELLENFKYSFAEFFTLGDPDFNSTLDKRTDALISKAYAEEIKKKISLTKTFKDPKHYSAMDFGTGMGGTTHVSVIDTDELFVSVTSSINSYFGSRLMTPSGVLLNNHMADFSTPQDKDGGNPYNYIEPGKRPLSAMAPTVVHDTEYKCGPRMAFGASNGTRLLSGMVEVFLNFYVAEMDLKTSIDMPRIHDQISPMGTWYEKNFSSSVVQKLRDYGHDVIEDPFALNAVQAALKINSTISAYSDPRKYGVADQF